MELPRDDGCLIATSESRQKEPTGAANCCLPVAPLGDHPEALGVPDVRLELPGRRRRGRGLRRLMTRGLLMNLLSGPLALPLGLPPWGVAPDGGRVPAAAAADASSRMILSCFGALHTAYDETRDFRPPESLRLVVSRTHEMTRTTANVWRLLQQNRESRGRDTGSEKAQS